LKLIILFKLIGRPYSFLRVRGFRLDNLLFIGGFKVGAGPHPFLF
jgi:hypothetical protein